MVVSFIALYSILILAFHFKRRDKCAYRILPYIAGCILLYSAYCLQRIFETRNNLMFDNKNKIKSETFKSSLKETKGDFLKNKLFSNFLKPEKNENYVDSSYVEKEKFVKSQAYQKERDLNDNLSNFKAHMETLDSVNGDYFRIFSGLRAIKESTLTSLCDFDIQFKTFIKKSQSISSQLKSIDIPIDGLLVDLNVYKENVLNYFRVLDVKPKSIKNDVKVPIINEKNIVKEVQNNNITPSVYIEEENTLDAAIINIPTTTVISKPQIIVKPNIVEAQEENGPSNKNQKKMLDKLKNTIKIKNPHQKVVSANKNIVLSSLIDKEEGNSILKNIFNSNFTDFLPHLSQKAPKKYEITVDFLLYIEMLLIIQGIVCFLVFLAGNSRKSVYCPLLRSILTFLLLFNVLLFTTVMIHSHTLNKRCINKTVNDCSFSNNTNIDDFLHLLRKGGNNFNSGHYENQLDEMKTIMNNMILESKRISSNLQSYFISILKNETDKKSNEFYNIFSKLKYIEDEFENIVNSKTVNKKEYYELIRRMDLNLNNIKFQIGTIKYDTIIKNMQDYVRISEYLENEKENLNVIFRDSILNREISSESAKCKRNLEKVCNSFSNLDEIFSLFLTFGIIFSASLLF